MTEAIRPPARPLGRLLDSSDWAEVAEVLISCRFVLLPGYGSFATEAEARLVRDMCQHVLPSGGFDV